MSTVRKSWSFILVLVFPRHQGYSRTQCQHWFHCSYWPSFTIFFSLSVFFLFRSDETEIERGGKTKRQRDLLWSKSPAGHLLCFVFVTVRTQQREENIRYLEFKSCVRKKKNDPWNYSKECPQYVKFMGNKAITLLLKIEIRVINWRE